MADLQEASEHDETNEGEESHKIFRITIRCTNCLSCQKVCPTDTIYFGSQHFVIDTDDCIGCEICIQVCPEDAIRVIA